MLCRLLFLALIGCTACGGGGGASSQAVPSVPAPSAAPTPTIPSGWRLTVYYTPVASFYSGSPQSVVGCSDLPCTSPHVMLGTFPSDFVATVQTEGTGKIANNSYLNWSSDVGYWHDILPRDAQGNPLMPFRSAAADPSIPFGTTFKILTCGNDTVTGTPTGSNVCSAYQSGSWIVADRFTAGAVGRHVDLYIGEQTTANFTAGANIIDASNASITMVPPVSSSAAWRPSVTDTFQWILSAALDTSANASVYDIDGSSSTASNLATLHSMGRHAVCYVNAGVYENFRADAPSFPSQIIGNADAGWPGEWWLDIRRIDLLGPIMQARLDTCKAKGFDAVEPDNVDGFENSTGFPLTAADQIVYNAWFASIAHERGMSVALKNDGTQVANLLPFFDFALTEDCWQQGWCAQVAPFRAAGKAVFTVEYTDLTSSTVFSTTVCPQALSAGDFAILKNRNLDAWRQACP